MMSQETDGFRGWNTGNITENDWLRKSRQLQAATASRELSISPRLHSSNSNLFNFQVGKNDKGRQKRLVARHLSLLIMGVDQGEEVVHLLASQKLQENWVQNCGCGIVCDLRISMLVPRWLEGKLDGLVAVLVATGVGAGIQQRALLLLHLLFLLRLLEVRTLFSHFFVQGIPVDFH